MKCQTQSHLSLALGVRPRRGRRRPRLGVSAAARPPIPHKPRRPTWTRTAARLLAAGNKAFKEGNFAEAEKAYREAFAVKKGYDIAGNLGAAELAQGKLREAAQHLAFTLRLFPITGEPALREQMQKAYDQCRQGVAAVRVKLDVRGATILVDGVAAGEAPLLDEVFVEPGEHVFEAQLEGYTGAPAARDRAEKGAVREVTLVLTPVPPPVTTIVQVAPPAAPQPRARARARGRGGGGARLRRRVSQPVRGQALERRGAADRRSSTPATAA